MRSRDGQHTNDIRAELHVISFCGKLFNRAPHDAATDGEYLTIE